LGGKSRVFDIDDKDVTDNLIQGVLGAPNAVLAAGAETAFSKERNLSCSVKVICRGADKVDRTRVTAAH
jgi:hypothetical protein